VVKLSLLKATIQAARHKDNSGFRIQYVLLSRAAFDNGILLCFDDINSCNICIFRHILGISWIAQTNQKSKK
jgi:hypothetical protein